MLRRHEIAIEAPASAGPPFFAAMDENYLRWHPDHLLFEWRQGRGLEIGVRFYFEERIGGHLLKKEVEFTEIVPDRLIRFVPTGFLLRLFIPWISFEFLADRPGRFRFRQSIPICIGPLGARLNRRDFDAVRRHMAEEGENLKAILETGRPVHVRPDRPVTGGMATANGH